MTQRELYGAGEYFALSRVLEHGGHGRPEQPGRGDRDENRAVNAHIGSESNERRNQDTEALERALAYLDDIADQVQADLQARLG